MIRRWRQGGLLPGAYETPEGTWMMDLLAHGTQVGTPAPPSQAPAPAPAPAPEDEAEAPAFEELHGTTYEGLHSCPASSRARWR